MPNNVLTQLKALRDGVADELRKDPRYQTLQSLDKSIAEITNVLASAGLLPPGKPASSLTARLNGLAPSLDALGEPTTTQQQITAVPSASAPEPLAPLPQSEPQSSAPTPAVDSKPGFKDGTVNHPAMAVPQKKERSLLKPAAGIAAALIAGGVAAEFLHEQAEGRAAKAKVEPSDADHETANEKPPIASDELNLIEPEATGAEETEREPGDGDAATDDADEEDGPEAAAESQAHHGHAASLGDAGDEDHAPTVALLDDDAAPGDDGAAADDGPATHGHAPIAPHDLSEHAAPDEADTGTAEGEAPGDVSGHADGQPDGEATEDAAAVVPKGKAAGYVPMAAKAGAPQYAPSIAVKFGKLPNKVDLRPLMTPVEDQGETSSCVANAVAGAYEYWIKKAVKKDQNISRLFVYYNARWRDGSQDKDGGSVIQLAMEGLQKFGACSEAVWPFDAHLVLKKPGAEAYQDGAPYRVHDMAQVPLKLDSWKQALAEGKPIVFGIELFDSFDECSKHGGVVPMPAPDDIARKKHSGHSMCAVGYSESEKVFIVRNSWGAGFGDKGYCYMPYDYILNPKFNDADCWVFVPKVPSQPPRETWQDDTTPVTNGGQGVDFEIQPYKVADYEKVAIDLFENVRRPWNPTIVAEYGQYVSAVSKSLFSELERFDVRTFLESTAILAGVGVTAELISESFHSESSSSESVNTLAASESSSESSESLSESEESAEDAEEDSEDDAEDAEEDAEDSAEDAQDDAEDDADSDEDDADSDKSDDDAESEDEDESDAEEDADDADDDAEEDDDAGDSEDSEEDGGDADEPDDEASDDDESGDDEGGGDDD